MRGRMAVRRVKGPVKKLKRFKPVSGPEPAPVRSFRPGVVAAISVVLIGVGVGIRRLTRPEPPLPQPVLPAVEPTVVVPAGPSGPAPPPPLPPRPRIVWPDAAPAAPEPLPPPRAQKAAPAPVPVEQILNEGVVNAAFAGVQAEVTACHSLYFRGTFTTGGVTVRLPVSDKGAGEAAIESSGFPSALFNECVARAAGHVLLPALPPGASATVRYTFSFQAR